MCYLRTNTRITYEKRKPERGGHYMLKYLHEHFVSHGQKGLITDVEVIFINKTDSFNPTKKAKFWRTKLNTLALDGLNVDEGLLMSSLL